MYAISFDIDGKKLTKHYGNDHTEPYNEVRTILQELGFIGIQGNLYLSKNEKNDLTTVYKVINKLSNVQWFSDSVRDIRAFKVEDWSDFTEIVRNNNK